MSFTGGFLTTVGIGVGLLTIVAMILVIGYLVEIVVKKRQRRVMEKAVEDVLKQRKM